eukprot:5036791-Prymnesium_polylepis.1
MSEVGRLAREPFARAHSLHQPAPRAQCFHRFRLRKVKRGHADVQVKLVTLEAADAAARVVE